MFKISATFLVFLLILDTTGPIAALHWLKWDIGLRVVLKLKFEKYISCDTIIGDRFQVFKTHLHEKIRGDKSFFVQNYGNKHRLNSPNVKEFQFLSFTFSEFCL